MEKGQRGEGDDESYSCRNRFISQKQKMNKNVSKICSIIQSLVLISPPHVGLLHALSGVCNLFPFSCVSPADTAQLCDIESDWWEKTSVRKSRKKPSCGLTWSCVEAQALGLCMSCGILAVFQVCLCKPPTSSIWSWHWLQIDFAPWPPTCLVTMDLSQHDCGWTWLLSPDLLCSSCLATVGRHTWWGHCLALTLGFPSVPEKPALACLLTSAPT